MTVSSPGALPSLPSSVQLLLKRTPWVMAIARHKLKLAAAAAVMSNYRLAAPKEMPPRIHWPMRSTFAARWGMSVTR